MSNYLGKAKNPNTGNLEDCEFLDDFYGKRQYAVRFKDGTTYPESEVEGLPMNELKPELWQNKFLREGDTNSCGELSIMIKTVSEILADQNDANAERIRELKIVPASTPHGSPYITGVNETAEDAARIVEVHK